MGEDARSEEYQDPALGKSWRSAKMGRIRGCSQREAGKTHVKSYTYSKLRSVPEKRKALDCLGNNDRVVQAWVDQANLVGSDEAVEFFGNQRCEIGIIQREEGPVVLRVANNKRTDFSCANGFEVLHVLVDDGPEGTTVGPIGEVADDRRRNLLETRQPRGPDACVHPTTATKLLNDAKDGAEDSDVSAPESIMAARNGALS
ncbi:hypothetical protein C8R44DRAFT_847586 [Mycena epipterygia]|nr:hypothetical protein C8R44DRAFT_847586 [Mycena epipterygia]